MTSASHLSLLLIPTLLLAYFTLLFLLLFTYFLCLWLVFRRVDALKNNTSFYHRYFLAPVLVATRSMPQTSSDFIAMSQTFVFENVIHTCMSASQTQISSSEFLSGMRRHNSFLSPSWLCWPSIPGILEDENHPCLCRASWALCQNTRPNYVEDERAQMQLVSTHRKHSVCGTVT